MTTIVSEKSKLRFYLTLAFTTIFYCGLGTAMFMMFTDRIKSGADLQLKDYFSVVFGCLLLFMAVYSIVRYIKNSPTVIVDERQISFNEEVYYWKDATKIDLTGKRPFKYIFKFPMEGAMLTFKDGTVKYFFDDVYSNSWKIKSFIHQVIVNGERDAEIRSHQVHPNEVRLESFENFKGNQFTSLRGIMLWGFLGFFILAVVIKGNAPPKGFIIFFGIFAAFWFTLNSYLMHYFALSEKYFVIRNHNFIWKSIVFRVEDIKEIVFETQGKMPNCLRIITKDFRNKFYPAGTLRDKTWLSLKAKLESKGVKVRNECI